MKRTCLWSIRLWIIYAYLEFLFRFVYFVVFCLTKCFMFSGFYFMGFVSCSRSNEVSFQLKWTFLANASAFTQPKTPVKHY